MIDLFEYEGKKVRLHLKNGDSISGILRLASPNFKYVLVDNGILITFEDFFGNWKIIRVELLEQ